MGIAVSASETEGLRLCELAPKYDCKLKEEDASTICQWARRRGHLKDLKDVFLLPAWKNIGADLWDSVQNKNAEAQRLAPIYRTMTKTMPKLHGEVEAKRAIRQALGVAEKEEGKDTGLTASGAPSKEVEVYPLSEAKKTALGGPTDSFPPYTSPVPEEAPFANPPAPPDPADAPLPMNKNIPGKTYPDLSQWKKNKKKAYEVLQAAAHRKTRSRARSRGGQAGALKARSGRPAAPSQPPAPRRARQGQGIARALRPLANLASHRPSHRAPRLPAARPPPASQAGTGGRWLSDRWRLQNRVLSEKSICNGKQDSKKAKQPRERSNAAHSRKTASAPQTQPKNTNADSSERHITALPAASLPNADQTHTHTGKTQIKRKERETDV